MGHNNSLFVLLGFGLITLVIKINDVSGSITKMQVILPSDSQTQTPQPTSSLIKPRTRISIPSSYAKSYWVSGTFFNNRNFKGLPMSFYFSSPKCVNFHVNVKKSIKPTGCVMLYKEKNCMGPYLMASDDMAELGMGQINSMKSCPPLDDSWRKDKQDDSENKDTESVLETPQESRAQYRTVDFGKASYQPKSLSW